MPSLPTISPEQAAAENSHSFFAPASQAPEIAARQAALNRAKRPAYIPKAVIAESDRKKLYIFNVGPKRHEGNGASYGAMMIPACLPVDAEVPKGYKGKPGEYSEPLVIPGLPHEYYNKEGNTLDVQFHGDGEMEEPGYDFACQIIGGFTDHRGQFNGKMLAQRNSLQKFGVGISRVWPPSREDIELARKKMLAEYAVMVNEANEAHALGKFSSLGATDDYFIAARALGKTAKDCRWMEFSAEAAPRKTKNCPECAEEIMAEARRCRFCGSVFSKG